MKKQSAILALFLAAISLAAQTGSNSVTIYLGANHSTLFNEPEEAMTYHNGSWQPVSGLNYSRRISARLKWQAGLALSTPEYSRDQYFVWPEIEDGEPPFPKLPANNYERRRLFYLDIQTGCKIYLNEGRFRIFLYPFLKTNFLLSRRTSFTIYYFAHPLEEYSDHPEADNYRQANLAAGLGGGADFSLNSRLSIEVMSILNRQFWSIGGNYLQRDRLQNFNLIFGVNYHF